MHEIMREINFSAKSYSYSKNENLIIRDTQESLINLITKLYKVCKMSCLIFYIIIPQVSLFIFLRVITINFTFFKTISFYKTISFIIISLIYRVTIT